jgi:hypothetical protein
MRKSMIRKKCLRKEIDLCRMRQELCANGGCPSRFEAGAGNKLGRRSATALPPRAARKEREKVSGSGAAGPPGKKARKARKARKERKEGKALKTWQARHERKEGQARHARKEGLARHERKEGQTRHERKARQERHGAAAPARCRRGGTGTDVTPESQDPSGGRPDGPRGAGAAEPVNGRTELFLAGKRLQSSTCQIVRYVLEESQGKKNFWRV